MFDESSIEKLQISNDFSTDVHYWKPKDDIKGVICAIHGGMAHAGDYRNVGLYLKKHGFLTVSYDLRGHKQYLSHFESYSQLLNDSLYFLEHVHKQYSETPLFLLGHSMGGLILTSLIMEYPERIEALGAKGLILSSPYYQNAIPVHPLIIRVSSVVSKILPKKPVPMDDFTNMLSHDKKITEQFQRDQHNELRGSKSSMKMASQLLTAQKKLINNFPDINLPVFAVIAGDDHLANKDVSLKLLTEHVKNKLSKVYEIPENFHENLNETNREDTFNEILSWINKLSDDLKIDRG